MQASPITRDLITRSIDRAIMCLEWLPLPAFQKAVKDLELARLLINKTDL